MNMKPTKQAVYLPVKVGDNKEDFASATFYITKPSDNGEKITHFLKPQVAFVFTPEQLNEYTANVIKKALETACISTVLDEIKANTQYSSSRQLRFQEPLFLCFSLLSSVVLL